MPWFNCNIDNDTCCISINKGDGNIAIRCTINNFAMNIDLRQKIIPMQWFKFLNILRKVKKISIKQKKAKLIYCLIFLLRLNPMLYYALYLSYHSNTETVLFVCLSSGWATIKGRLLGPKVGNSIKCLSDMNAVQWHVKQKIQI